MKTNLLAKRIRLLFVADRIPPELRRVVEFLNETMDPVEVLAVEIRLYQGPRGRALVPQVIGQTSDALGRKVVGAERTNEGQFLAAWEDRGRGYEVMANLLASARDEGLAVRWGTKGFSLNIKADDQMVSVLEAYPPGIRPNLLVWFGALARKVRDPDPIISTYRKRMEGLQGFSPTTNGFRSADANISSAEETALHDAIREVARQVAEHGLVT